MLVGSPKTGTKKWREDSHDDSTGLLIMNEETGYVTIDLSTTHTHDAAELADYFVRSALFLPRRLSINRLSGITLDPLLLLFYLEKFPLSFHMATMQLSMARKLPPADPLHERYGPVMGGKSVLQLSEPQFYRA